MNSGFWIQGFGFWGGLFRKKGRYEERGGVGGDRVEKSGVEKYRLITHLVSHDGLML